MALLPCTLLGTAPPAATAVPVARTPFAPTRSRLGCIWVDPVCEQSLASLQAHHLAVPCRAGTTRLSSRGMPRPPSLRRTRLASRCARHPAGYQRDMREGPHHPTTLHPCTAGMLAPRALPVVPVISACLITYTVRKTHARNQQIRRVHFCALARLIGCGKHAGATHAIAPCNPARGQRLKQPQQSLLNIPGSGLTLPR